MLCYAMLCSGVTVDESGQHFVVLKDQAGKQAVIAAGCARSRATVRKIILVGWCN